MSRIQMAQMRGEIRLWRAILQATEADLRAAFARRDRRAVQCLTLEAEEVRGVIADLAQQVRLASQLKRSDRLESSRYDAACS